MLSTVAVPVLEELQLTALFVALDGVTVAVRVSDPPSTKLRLVLLRVTPVTATVCVPPPPDPPFGPVSSSCSHPENIAAEITATNTIMVSNNFLIEQ